MDVYEAVLSRRAVRGVHVRSAGAAAGSWVTGSPGRRAPAVGAVRRLFWAATATACAVLGTQAVGRPPLVALLAFAFGLQNSTARRMAVPDLSTTVLTLTVTGLAADSRIAGGPGAHPVRRIASITAMLGGAAAGALLVQCRQPSPWLRDTSRRPPGSRRRRAASAR